MQSMFGNPKQFADDGRTGYRRNTPLACLFLGYNEVMQFFRRAHSVSSHFLLLNTLHILNDGFLASFVLLLPFLAEAQNLSLAQIGVLGAILNMSSIALALPASAIASKVGGLRTLHLGLFAYGLGFVGAGISGNYGWLLAMFALGGVGFGIFHPVAFALLAKWSPKESRGRLIGNFTAIGDIGRVAISAALSFLIVYLGWRYTSWLYGALALIPAVWLVGYLRKRRDTIVEEEKTPVQQLSWLQVLKNPRYALAVSADVLDTFAVDSLYVFLPFLLLERGVDPAWLGAFGAAFFVGNIFGKTLLGRLVDKIGSAKVFIGSELLMAALIFLLATTTQMHLIVIFSLVLGVFAKGTIPVLKAMIAESVEHHGNFEKAFGVAEFVTGFSKTGAPLILGIIAGSAGIVWAFNTMAIAVLVAVIPAVFFFASKPHGKST